MLSAIKSGLLFRRRACSPCISDSKVDIWPPFPESLKLKLKLIFLKSRDLPSFSGVAKAKAKLIFLKSRSGFGLPFPVSRSVQRIWLFSGVELARPVYRTQKYILASFSRVAKAKAKAYFFEKQIWLPFLVSLLKLKLNLYFLKSRSGFGTKNLASFSSVALSAKNLAFFFWRFARLPFLPDSKAEIEKTVGICSSAQAYFFLKSRSGFLFWRQA
jgi:hypothetical protein